MGIGPIAKRVVPMDSLGRYLRVARSSEPFEIFSGLLGYSGKLAWLRQAWAYRGEIGGKSSVCQYTRCISLGIAPIAKRVVPLDSPGRWLRNTRSSDRFGYLSSLLGYPNKLAWLRQAWTWAILAYFDLFWPRLWCYDRRNFAE